MTANKDRFDTLVGEINTLLDTAEAAEATEDATAAQTVAAYQEQIRVLEEQIAAGDMSGAEETAAFAALDALKARVATLAGGGTPPPVEVPVEEPDVPVPGDETPDVPVAETPSEEPHA